MNELLNYQVYRVDDFELNNEYVIPGVLLYLWLRRYSVYPLINDYNTFILTLRQTYD